MDTDTPGPPEAVLAIRCIWHTSNIVDKSISESRHNYDSIHTSFVRGLFRYEFDMRSL